MVVAVQAVRVANFTEHLTWRAAIFLRHRDAHSSSCVLILAEGTVLNSNHKFCKVHHDFEEQSQNLRSDRDECATIDERTRWAANSRRTLPIRRTFRRGLY